MVKNVETVKGDSFDAFDVLDVFDQIKTPRFNLMDKCIKKSSPEQGQGQKQQDKEQNPQGDIFTLQIGL